MNRVLSVGTVGAVRLSAMTSHFVYDTPQLSLAIHEYGPAYTGVALYLDPERRHVYTFGRIGSGVPEAVWHGRHKYLADVPRQVAAESLYDWLRTQESTLTAIAEGYLGTRWDGHNHVGDWTEQACELTDSFDSALVAALDDGVVARYWEACDYFMPAQHDVVQAVLLDASLDAAVTRELSEARTQGVQLAADETRATLVDLLRRREQELTSEWDWDGVVATENDEPEDWREWIEAYNERERCRELLATEA